MINIFSSGRFSISTPAMHGQELSFRQTQPVRCNGRTLGRNLRYLHPRCLGVDDPCEVQRHCRLVISIAQSQLNANHPLSLLLNRLYYKGLPAQRKRFVCQRDLPQTKQVCWFWFQDFKLFVSDHRVGISNSVFLLKLPIALSKLSSF